MTHEMFNHKAEEVGGWVVKVGGRVICIASHFIEGKFFSQKAVRRLFPDPL